MKIGVIGAHGFIGSEIVSVLTKNFEIVEIIRDNYNENIGRKFDVLINASGNSVKHLANKYPKDDFKASVLTVMDTFFDFKYDEYIHISSIDAENKDDFYGFHKKIAEELVMKYCDNWLIIRCCLVIGKNARKGPIKDIQDGTDVYITESSRLQLITVNAVALELRKAMCTKRNEILKFYSSHSITIKRIANILNKKPIINKEALKVFYDYKNTDPELKSAAQYLKDIL